MPESKSFVSVVAIVRNDPGIRAFVTEVLDVLASHYADYELVLVDDGSADATPLLIQRVLAEQESVRLVRLSREFGNDVAITAGLDSAIGDFAVVMLAACDPPQAIPLMVDLGEAGAEVVLGTCRRRPGESLLFRQGRRIFYRLCHRLTKVHLPPDVASMRMLSRLALNGLTQIRQKTMHHRLVSCGLGFRTEVLEYEQMPGSRAPRPLWRAVGEACSMVISNSRFPLRLVSFVGVAAASLNLLYMVYIVAVNLFKQQVAEGWTTLSLQMSVMFLLVFSTLIVISEYLAQTLEETKDRPLYHVAEEKNSSTALADSRKRNVYLHHTESSAHRIAG